MPLDVTRFSVDVSCYGWAWVPRHQAFLMLSYTYGGTGVVLLTPCVTSFKDKSKSVVVQDVSVTHHFGLFVKKKS